MASNTLLLLNVPFRIVKEPHGGDVYTTADEALARSGEIAETGATCEGVHGFTGDGGELLFMPCGSHAEWETAVEEQSAHDEDDKKSPHTDSIVKGGDVVLAQKAEPEPALTEEEIGTGVVIEGPVSSGVMDRDGDIVEPKAVMDAWATYQKNPIVLHNHQRGGIGRMIDVRMGEWPGLDHKVPIGRALIDGEEKSIVSKVRKGIIRAFSIGFIAKAGGIEKVTDEDGNVIHRFTKIDWVETSVVDIPSNPMALFDVVKDCYRVRTKSAAPDSFNNPFSMWVFRTGETSMTDADQEMTEQDEVVLEEVPIVEEPMAPDVEIKSIEQSDSEETEEVEVEVTVPDVSDRMNALEEKFDAIIDHFTKDAEVEVEEVEDNELLAEVTALRAEKAAAEQEAFIQAEVDSRVQAALGNDTARVPERKTMVNTEPEIGRDVFEALAEERGTSVGTIKGEAWLASMIGGRGSNNQ